METIGERIKDALLERRIQVNQIADMMQRAQSTVSNYITNRSYPSEVFFVSIKKIIPDLNLNWLITGSGEMFLTEAANVNQGEDVNVLKKEIEHLKEVQNTLMRTLDTLTSIEKRSFNKVVRETGDKINLLDEKLVRVIPFLNLYRKGTVERTA